MTTARSMTWRYGVCALMMLAGVLLYMDRLTLSQLATTICLEYSLTNERFGLLASGFSIAFAAGALFFGVLVDRIGPRWLYPCVVIGWSCAGIATAYAETIGGWFLAPDADLSDKAYLGFMLCRIALGFFESGHWPCALVTTRVILSRGDRTLGNSILQSGSSIGSIVTPLVVLPMVKYEPGGWRPPFMMIGLIGMIWIVPWLMVIRPADVARDAASNAADEAADPAPRRSSGDRFRMMAVLVVVVITINLTWQYFSNWLPKFLQESHGYSLAQAGAFTSAYYVSAEVGCLGAGLLVKWLATRGHDVHDAKVLTFTCCAGLTLIAVAAAFLPAGALLFVVLLIAAAGTLGFYPNYYSFAQELTRAHQGKISGSLATIAWLPSALMQWLAGRSIDKTESYAAGIIMAGTVPLLACAALWLLWPRHASSEPEA